MSWKDYIVETAYKGIAPLCKCGCQQETSMHGSKTKFNDYVHGHNTTILSDKARASIGKKNSQKMTQFYKKNHNEAHQRTKRMREFLTEDVIVKRGQAIKAAYESLELKKKIGEKSRRFWAENPDVRKRTSIKTKETWHFRNSKNEYEEMKQHLSEVMTQKLINDEMLWERGKYTSIKTNCTCNYKSSWELIVMKQLDSSDKVITWSYEKIWMKYEDDDGRIRRYTPDFLIKMHNKTIMVEIKPTYSQKRQQQKLKRAQEYCDENNLKFLIWDSPNRNIVDVLEKL